MPRVSKRAKAKKTKPRSETTKPVVQEAPAERQKWRLKRTLARSVSYRPIEQEDMKYVWAAYQKGALGSMGDAWKQPTMSVAEFDTTFKTEIIANYSSAWTLFAQTKAGTRPVGLVLAFYSHPNPVLAPFQIIGDIIWFPWASTRNRIETAVNFFSKVRNEHSLVEYARGDATKRFFETIAKHGVMRRVGTTFNVFHGEAVAVFETRRA